MGDDTPATVAHLHKALGDLHVQEMSELGAELRRVTSVAAKPANKHQHSGEQEDAGADPSWLCVEGGGRRPPEGS